MRTAEPPGQTWSTLILVYGAVFTAIEITKAAGVETIALANDPLPEGEIPVIPK